MDFGYTVLDIVFSLLLTVMGYALIPLIITAVRKQPITKRNYRLMCFGFNFLVNLVFSLLGSKGSAAPYLLWTTAFSAAGLNMLAERGLLIAPETKPEAGAQGQPVPVRTGEFRVRFCIRCGSEMREGNRFCGKCGAPVPQLTEDWDW